MATSNQGYGRSVPPGGADGQVPVVDTTNEGPNDTEWADGNDVKYVPTTSGDWGGSVPTTLGAALDTIAASITIS